jgi:hypothetical protein
MLLYPRLRSLSVAVVGGAILALLSLPLAVSRFANGSILEGAAFGALGLGCAYGAVLLVAQLVRPRPVAAVDEDGFACAAGAVRWVDVIDVSTYLQVTYLFGNRRKLMLRFEHGTEVTHPDRQFLNSWLFGRPELRPTALVMPTWTRKEDVTSAIRRFYGGPIAE